MKIVLKDGSGNKKNPQDFRKNLEYVRIQINRFHSVQIKDLDFIFIGLN